MSTAHEVNTHLALNIFLKQINLQLFCLGEYASCTARLDAESQTATTQFNKTLCKHVQQGASEFSLRKNYLPEIESMKIDANVINVTTLTYTIALQDLAEVIIYCAHSSYGALCAGLYRRAYKRAINGLKLVDVVRKMKHGNR
jgi:hypothetical protein